MSDLYNSHSTFRRPIVIFNISRCQQTWNSKLRTDSLSKIQTFLSNSTANEALANEALHCAYCSTLQTLFG